MIVPLPALTLTSVTLAALLTDLPSSLGPTLCGFSLGLVNSISRQIL